MNDLPVFLNGFVAIAALATAVFAPKRFQPWAGNRNIEPWLKRTALYLWRLLMLLVSVRAAIRVGVGLDMVAPERGQYVRNWLSTGLLLVFGGGFMVVLLERYLPRR